MGCNGYSRRGAGAYTAIHLYEVAQLLGEPASLSRVMGWASDPLLTILLVEAVVLRCSVADAGWGLLSECWEPSGRQF